MQRKIISKIHVKFSPEFDSDLDKASVDIQLDFYEAYDIFLEDQNHKSLRNHPLDKIKKRYHGLRSIDVTSDYRAVYRKKGKIIIFIMLRTHKELYK